MSRNERLIGLMKLHEKLLARRYARAVGELSGEIGRADAMQEKLADLLGANTPTGETMTPFALRSRAWYGRQMQEQLELLQNRRGFLSAELDQARSALLKHKNREITLEDRRVTTRRSDAENRERHAEGLMPPRGAKPKI
jgi:hypothetical protein